MNNFETFNIDALEPDELKVWIGALMAERRAWRARALKAEAEREPVSSSEERPTMAEVPKRDFAKNYPADPNALDPRCEAVFNGERCGQPNEARDGRHSGHIPDVHDADMSCHPYQSEPVSESDAALRALFQPLVNEGTPFRPEYLQVFYRPLGVPKPAPEPVEDECPCACCSRADCNCGDYSEDEQCECQFCSAQLDGWSRTEQVVLGETFARWKGRGAGWTVRADVPLAVEEAIRAEAEPDTAALMMSITHRWNQLYDENVRLREALVHIRDLTDPNHAEVIARRALRVTSVNEATPEEGNKV